MSKRQKDFGPFRTPVSAPRTPSRWSLEKCPIKNRNQCPKCSEMGVRLKPKRLSEMGRKMQKEVDKIVEIKPGKSKSAGQSAKILESFGFPKHITEILAEAEAKNKKNKTASISSQLLRTAGAYTILATPARGRAPSPSSIMKKLEASGLHDQKILNALKETVLPQHS